MAFSGGTYTLPAGNPVTAGNTIEASWANTTLNDIATALSTCVLKDGTQTLTANLPMAGFKLTGLGAGSASTDSVRLGQLQNSTVQYVTGTAGTNTITASASPTLTALTAGQVFRFIPANTNTAATTLQIDSTAATSIFWNNVALTGGEIRQNVPVVVFYDGTQYQLIGSGAAANTFAMPDTLRIQAAGDRTKQLAVSLTGITTGATRTITMPDTDVNLNGLTGTQSASTFFAGPTSGAAALPSFRALSGTDVGLLATKTAASASGITFTTTDFNWTAYDEYEFHFLSLVPTTGAGLVVLVSQDSGVSYITTASYFYAMQGYTSAGVRDDVGGASTATPRMVNAISPTVARGGLVGKVVMAQPSSSVSDKRFYGNFGYTDSNGNHQTKTASVSYEGNQNAITGVKFASELGVWTSGAIAVYAVKK